MRAFLCFSGELSGAKNETKSAGFSAAGEEAILERSVAVALCCGGSAFRLRSRQRRSD